MKLRQAMIIVILLATSVFGAVNTSTKIAGTVIGPDLSPFDGTLVLQLPFGGVVTSEGKVVPPVTVKYTIQSGSIVSPSSPTLINNADMVPGNTYYIAYLYNSYGALISRYNIQIPDVALFDIGAAQQSIFTSNNISLFSGSSGNVQFVNKTLSRGGIDFGDEMNKAYAALPSNGGNIFIAGDASCYNYTTQIVWNTVGKVINTTGGGSGPVCTNYTGTTGTGWTINWGGNSGIQGHPGTINNIAICSAGCLISGAVNTTIGMNIGSGPNFPTQGVIVENVAFQGWGTGLIDFGFDMHFVDLVFLNNGIGINSTGGSPMWIDRGLMSQNTQEDILLSGSATTTYIDGTDIETNLGTGSKALVCTGNTLTFTAVGVHWESNGAGSTGDFINCTTSQNTFTIIGGEMIYDSGVGAVPEFITFNSDWLMMHGVAMIVVNLGGNSVTQFINSTGFSTIQFCNRISGVTPSSGLIAGIGGASISDCQNGPSTSMGWWQLKNYKFQISPVLFSALPACAAGTEGMIASVSDDNTAVAWGSTITGGGANHVMGYCDGINWTIAGK